MTHPPFRFGPALLFCPADRPDRFEKAADRADAVILDLEDAVAQEAKHDARLALVAATLDPERVIVRVTDTGSGVPESHAGRLFDEFYQVNNHERDRRKGFGMGLAICSSLAQQLGGNVRLASTGADGSCFEVCFKSARHDRGGRRHSPAGNVGYPEEARLCPA